MLTTQKITKKERRQNALNKHYNALQNLAAICGVTNADGKKLSVKLLKLENEARELTIMECNGEGNKTANNTRLNEIEGEVFNLFNNAAFLGFYINTDGRGKALKINDTEMRTIYQNTGLFTDWVGNGLLAPDIDEY